MKEITSSMKGGHKLPILRRRRLWTDPARKLLRKFPNCLQEISCPLMSFQCKIECLEKKNKNKEDIIHVW